MGDPNRAGQLPLHARASPSWNESTTITTPIASCSVLHQRSLVIATDHITLISCHRRVTPSGMSTRTACAPSVRIDLFLRSSYGGVLGHHLVGDITAPFNPNFFEGISIVYGYLEYVVEVLLILIML